MALNNTKIKNKGKTIKNTDVEIQVYSVLIKDNDKTGYISIEIEVADINILEMIFNKPYDIIIGYENHEYLIRNIPLHKYFFAFKNNTIKAILLFDNKIPLPKSDTQNLLIPPFHNRKNIVFITRINESMKVFNNIITDYNEEIEIIDYEYQIQFPSSKDYSFYEETPNTSTEKNEEIVIKAYGDYNKTYKIIINQNKIKINEDIKCENCFIITTNPHYSFQENSINIKKEEILFISLKLNEALQYKNKNNLMHYNISNINISVDNLLKNVYENNDLFNINFIKSIP